jgi:hypothetical protein
MAALTVQKVLAECCMQVVLIHKLCNYFVQNNIYIGQLIQGNYSVFQQGYYLIVDNFPHNFKPSNVINGDHPLRLRFPHNPIPSNLGLRHMY